VVTRTENFLGLQYAYISARLSIWW